MSQNALSRKLNGKRKVILDTHPESDQHQNWTCSRGSPPAPTHQIWWWSMNPFLRYLADKNSAHTDRHTPLTTRPDGLRRAGNYAQWPSMWDLPGKVLYFRAFPGCAHFSCICLKLRAIMHYLSLRPVTMKYNCCYLGNSLSCMSSTFAYCLYPKSYLPILCGPYKHPEIVFIISSTKHGTLGICHPE